MAGAAGESTAVVGAAGVGGAQLAAAHGKHGAAAVTALQKAGIDIVIDLHAAVMAGGALLPQGTGGGKGAVVDDSLMMMLKHQMVALVPFDLGSVDLPAGVFALPQCADVEVVIQNALHRNDGPRGPGGAFDALALRFSAIALGHARRGNALVSQVVGDLFVAPAVVVKAENLTHDLRLGGDDFELPLLVEDIAVWRSAKPRAVRLPPLDNRLDLLAGVGDRHFVDEELKLDLQPVIIVGKVNAVADGDDADACVAQILQLHQATTVAARESGEVLDDENVIPVLHQSAPHGLIALPLLKRITGAIAVFEKGQRAVRKAMLDKIRDDGFLVFDGGVVPIQLFVY